MRITAIIKIALDYFLIGIIGLAFAFVIFGIGYFAIYKRLLKGTKTLKMSQVILYAILFIYIIIVLGATLGIRSQMGKHINIHLFSSYIEAWNSFSATEWRNIILNILMFVPLGFVMPIISIKCRRWWLTYLVGFLSSSLLELIQLVTRRGIFELDDIFNNTLGCMIGYGIVMIFILYLIDKKEKSKNKGLTLSCLQIPLCVTIIVFSIIFTKYSKQDLGNLSVSYSYSQDISNININTNIKFNDQPDKVYVYKAVVGSKEDRLRIANEILSAVKKQVDESKNDIYDDTIIYYSGDGKYSVWVDYIGLTTRYTDFSHVSNSKLEGLSYDEINDLLKSFYIKLPEEVDFIDKGDGSYEISVNMANIGDVLLNGKLTCVIEDSRIVSNFDNDIVSYAKYKEYEVISEQEAYNELLEGKFKAYSLSDKIEIKDSQLTYEIDSKGFYQPVYEFILEGTDMEQSIVIPALKQ